MRKLLVKRICAVSLVSLSSLSVVSNMSSYAVPPKRSTVVTCDENTEALAVNKLDEAYGLINGMETYLFPFLCKLFETNRKARRQVSKIAPGKVAEIYGRAPEEYARRCRKMHMCESSSPEELLDACLWSNKCFADLDRAIDILESIDCVGLDDDIVYDVSSGLLIAEKFKLVLCSFRDGEEIDLEELDLQGLLDTVLPGKFEVEIKRKHS